MVPGGPCPGRCNANWRKADEAYKEALALYDPLDPGQERPAPPEIYPEPGMPYWCGRCTSTIRQYLDDLDYAACIMTASADGLRGGSGEQQVGGSREAPTPSSAGDDMEELLSMLTAWEDSFRSIKGWKPRPRRDFLASAITTTAGWLMGHLDDILVCGDIAEPFGHEVMLWHREITGKGKEGVRRLRKPMRCPSCRLLTLVWTEGEKYVHCANPPCGRMMTLPEYEAEVTLRAGAARAAEAAQEAAEMSAA